MILFFTSFKNNLIKKLNKFDNIESVNLLYNEYPVTNIFEVITKENK